MTKYIAFLRGINVGNIRIKMADLKVAFENLGFQEVITYLQTGNVVFLSEKALPEIKVILEKGLSDTFKYDAYVLLKEYADLKEIIAQYPFEFNETHHAYILFVDNERVFDELISISKDLEDAADIAMGNHQVIYSKVIIGNTLSTPFAKILAKAKYKSSVTTRNLNTLEKM
jgi:uncharacterized protein (DUF1697 family)